MSYLNIGARLKAFRNDQNLSLSQLAEKSGLDVKNLEAIEGNEKTPKIAELIQLAKSLEINVADIFRERPQKQSYELVKSQERQKISPLLDPTKSKRLDYSYELLTLPGDEKHLEAYLIEIPGGQAEKPEEKLSHPGEEFIFMLEGKVEGIVNSEKVLIEQGDSLFLFSRVPHSFYNPFAEKARALSVIYPY